MWFQLLIFSILFNTLLASPPGSRGRTSDENYQVSWNSRNDQSAKPSTSSSNDYRLAPQTHPLDLSTKKRNNDENKFSTTSTGVTSRRYNCDKCDKSYTELRSLANHVKTIHEGRKITCSECFQSFSDRSGLHYHKQTIHQGVTYDCTKCGKKLTRKAILKEHERKMH